ncbi:hypothetical protein LS71_001635 [Helicobacter jaachi]|uniref:Uncharacterized protein n=1 Tax=Helicobacter jaachi TaxID=1677920 RepID=A0A4U8TDU5_9HELI|nr:hypothetical protein LS71_001635 [Helicobacter jaachi]
MQTHPTQTYQRLIIWGYFLALFGALLLFYGYMYPVVVFWGDDWQMLSGEPSLRPKPHSWIPARILPVYLQSFIGSFGNYIITPIVSLFTPISFLDSISLSVALICASAFSALNFALYILTRALTQRHIFSLLCPTLFTLGIFVAMRAHLMPLAYPADLEAEGMGYVLTVMCFYTLPYILNLCLVIFFLLVFLGFVTQRQLVVFINGGGGDTHIFEPIFNDHSKLHFGKLCWAFALLYALSTPKIKDYRI